MINSEIRNKEGITKDKLGASFRDPSGFVFNLNGKIYRQINRSYQNDYDQLIYSGLYDKLTSEHLLIPHKEVEVPPEISDSAYKVILPDLITFISYPYEWCFSQLKDAAQVTLEIQKHALEYGMSLKDSSVYNIQFHHGRPLMIDTLSFEIYREGQPWDAYRQFCQHFLAPLSLIAYRDVRLSQLMRAYVDGIPLDLTSRLLPWRTYLFPGLFLHIHMHSVSQRRYAGKTINSSNNFSMVAFLGLIDSLESSIRRLSWSPRNTEWGEYYDQHNYTPEGFDHKKQLVSEYLEYIQPRCVWDLGANVGEFSRLASERKKPTLSLDIDPGAVEKNYLDSIIRGDKHLLPLVLDLTNPSSSIGWDNKERFSLLERASADTILSLAMIHHLAISNNVPLENIASFLHQLGKWQIIEFVPKSDPQVQRMLATRKNIFTDYSKENFERVFSQIFSIDKEDVIKDSHRNLYLMRRLSE